MLCIRAALVVLFSGRFLFVSCSDRTTSSYFPILSHLASLPRAQLIRSYLPNANSNATTLNDEACPAFLITGDLLVCGNLFVRSRLQVITAANLTVFEEALFNDNDDSDDNEAPQKVTIKTHIVGKFLAARCSRTYPHYSQIGGEELRCSVKGNLVVVQSGLIVSGSLTVLGSVMAGSLQMDGAASAAFGVGAFLNIHNATESAEDSGDLQRRNAARASRRGTRKIIDNQGPVVPLDIWPPSARLDQLCLERKNVQDSLFIAKGITFIRNAANLFTFGRSVLYVAGLDRSAQWLSRCGGLLLTNPDGTPGHLGILSASQLRVTGPNTVETGSLLVADASVLTIEENLQVSEICKIFQSSTLEVRGELDSFDLVMSRSSVAAISRLFVKDLMILTQAHLLVSQVLHVNSMEAYDGSAVEAQTDLQVEDYVVLDDGSTVTVINGDATIGGAIMAANFSTFSVRSSKGLLTVGEDLRLRTGVILEAPQAVIGCSVLLDIYAKLLISGDIFIRNRNILVGPEKKSPLCDDASPVLYARQSSMVTGPWTVGGRRIKSNSNTTNDKPLATIMDKTSLVMRGSYQSATRDHALLLKNAASMHISDASIFDPGKLVMLESSSSLVIDGVARASFVGLDLAENAEVLVQGPTDVSMQWLKMLSRSKFVSEASTTVTVDKLLELELESLLAFRGALYFNEQLLDHVLCTTRSIFEVTALEVPMVVSGNWIAQDGGEIRIDREATIMTDSATLIAETFSSIVLAGTVTPSNTSEQIHIQRTLESEIALTNQDSLSIVESIYRLKVPPSDATSLTQFVKNMKQPVKKNAFWDSWVQTTAAESATEAPTANHKPSKNLDLPRALNINPADSMTINDVVGARRRVSRRAQRPAF